MISPSVEMTWSVKLYLIVMSKECDLSTFDKDYDTFSVVFPLLVIRMFEMTRSVKCDFGVMSKKETSHQSNQNI